jgi:glycosyltransferase involved in cell wall biosynthesis
LRLLLAGPPSDYYHAAIKPLLNDPAIQYVGFVNGSERSRLLGGARALLYPVCEAEPFGLVLAEAMMCGTPVAAMGLGAVPEIVDEGISGSCAASPAEFPQAVLRALALDRRRVRARAEERFTAQRMAGEYVAVYQSVARGVGASTGVGTGDCGHYVHG